MDITLWIIQGLLAFVFLMAGIMKLTTPKDKLRDKVGDWVDGVSDTTIQGIGLAEFLGAVGVILPMLVGVVEIMTPVAAIGLSLTMVAGMALHAKRKEYKEVGINVVIMLLALFVVFGRLSLVPVI